MTQTKQRRKFSATFKTKVVLEALKERQTIEELARKYELHPTQISSWKKEFLDNVNRVFENNSTGKDHQKGSEKEQQQLYAQIGQLKVENDWLKKNYSETAYRKTSYDR